MRDSITYYELVRRLSYDRETGVFVWRHKDDDSRLGRTWNTVREGTIAGRLRSDGYREIKIDGVAYLAHRLAWLFVNASWPMAGIDHKDSIKDNNAINNLREANQSQNMANIYVHPRNKLGIKGVMFAKRERKFKAQIKHGGKVRHLGYFDDPESAAEAYRIAAKKFHGDFARF